MSLVISVDTVGAFESVVNRLLIPVANAGKLLIALDTLLFPSLEILLDSRLIPSIPCDKLLAPLILLVKFLMELDALYKDSVSTFPNLSMFLASLVKSDVLVELMLLIELDNLFIPPASLFNPSAFIPLRLFSTLDNLSIILSN